MAQDIYDPLTEYINVFRDRFKEVAKTTFADLAKEANVDVEANRKTCSQLYDTQAKLDTLDSRIGSLKALRVVLWIGVAGGVIYCIAQYDVVEPRIIYAVGGGVASVLLLLFALIRPRMKKLKKERGVLEEAAAKLSEEAWQQMEPLNRLYDWDVLTRMMTKTVPKLEFDPYFTTRRLADLQNVYGWDGSFNKDRSVIYSHSGLINGNPFVICRTRKMEMGTKVYTGQKVIHWTAVVRGSDGKSHTVTRTQVLVASVTAPYPGHFEKTRLIYGNTAAPDLIFYRKKSGLAIRENSRVYRKTRRKLRKKARDLTNKDFAMMTNEEFEVVFDSSNRNNNQQFAMLFTPLAQESMLKLLKDRKYGYGDDFDFDKNKMINTILPDHMQKLDLDMNPDRYRSFDYDKAEKGFYEVNSELFRAIYFSLAPLLCVPMYQQIRSQEDIYGRDMQQRSAFWEHEAIANFWGENRFKAANCVTPCILKTQQVRGQGDDSTIMVYAHGFRSEQRLTYVSKLGGDGRMHRVPVYWDEYLPVTGTGKMQIREDNDSTADTASSQSERLDHIRSVLSASNLALYRRHIASGV